MTSKMNVEVDLNPVHNMDMLARSAESAGMTIEAFTELLAEGLIQHLIVEEKDTEVGRTSKTKANT
jgi:hypothetical protein